jgi:glycosyltransferase involved in cell wall biosynthesis
MKQVLFLTYYWPPDGGGGVQRGTKFAKYLQHFGWEPIILTVAAGNPPHTDPSLLRDVANIKNVYRARSLEPHTLYKKLFSRKKEQKAGTASSPQGHPLADWIRLNLFIPDSRIGWRRPAIKLGLDIIKRHQIQMIFSSAPPYTAHRIARQLHNQTGIPWVADFRDPWFENFTYNTQYRLPPVKWITRRMENNVLTSAQAIISVGAGLNNLLQRKRPPSEANRFHVIPNGYDSDDIKLIPAASGKNDAFTLAYYGTLYNDGFPSVFTEALQALCRDDKRFCKDLRIRLVGKTDEKTLALFTHFLPTSQLTTCPYIPHEEMLQALQAPQVLLLFVSNVPHADIILTGKVFEYLPTGNPILAIAPPGGDLDRLLRETDRGRAYNYNDKIGIMNFLKDQYGAWQASSHRRQPDRYPEYDRRTLTHDLARIFNALTTA